MPWQLIIPAAASLATAALFLIVARRLIIAPHTRELRSASMAFALWWTAIGITLLSDAGRILLGLSADPSVTAYVSLSILKLVLTSGALAALASYVAFLHTGHDRWNLPIAILAVAHAAFFLWAFLARLPAEVEVQTWSTRLNLQPSLAIPEPVQALVFYIPGLAIAIAYGLLWKNLTDTAQRKRFLAVLAGLLVLFGVGAIQYNPTTSAETAWFLVFPALTVLLGILVYRGVPRKTPSSPPPLPSLEKRL